MTIYNGKNSNEKAKTFFYSRAKYKFGAFNFLGPNLLKSIKDFTYTDFALYGKIDGNGFSVIPKQESLVGYLLSPSQEVPIKMIGFVGLQLDDLLNLINRNVTTGRIPANGSFLSRLKPTMGYINPIDEYNKYINTMMETFTSNFVKKNKNKIKNFNDYLNVFISFVTKVTPCFPCTFSGWYKTRNSSPFSSGLYIDMLNISKHIDSEKEQIVTDPNFPFYVNACQQYGFCISKNNPNIIVSDLNSPALTKYIIDSGIMGAKQIFNEMYRKVEEYDLALLSQFLTQGYNNFKLKQPNIKSFKFGKNGHMISNLSLRESINNINISVYIKLYILLRNIEENNYYNKFEIKEIIKNTSFLSNRLDIKQLIGYINFQYLSNYAIKSGSGTWFKKQMEDK